MSKMVKLSDEVGYSLSKRAEEDGLTMSGEVAKLLATSEMPPHPTDLDYFDKKFDELKSLIENNLVDVVAAGGTRRRAPGEKEWVPWAQMQYIIFSHEDDDSAWIPSTQAIFQFKNGDPNEMAYYVQDGVIYIDKDQPIALLKVTPGIREAIDKHFTYDD